MKKTNPHTLRLQKRIERARAARIEEKKLTYGVMAIYRTILIDRCPVTVVERDHDGDTAWYHIHRGSSVKMSNCIGTLR